MPNSTTVDNIIARTISNVGILDGAFAEKGKRKVW